jgi:hypothetical protein
LQELVRARPSLGRSTVLRNCCGHLRFDEATASDGGTGYRQKSPASLCRALEHQRRIGGREEALDGAAARRRRIEPRPIVGFACQQHWHPIVADRFDQRVGCRGEQRTRLDDFPVAAFDDSHKPANANVRWSAKMMGTVASG